MRSECHHVVFGLLDTNFLYTPYSEVEDGFHRMLGDTLLDLALLHL